MNEAQRRRVQARFGLLFGHLPVDERSDMLGVTPRSIRRIELETHVPVLAVAQKMEKAIEEAIEYAQMSPHERMAAQDRERARREARQRQIDPDFRIDDVKKDYPAFMRTALKRLKERKYQTVVDILQDRVEDPDEWKRVPDKVKPYVLQTLAFAQYFCGRMTEAISAYNRALAAAGHDPALSMLRQACWSTLAGVHLTLGQLDEGFKAVGRAISLSRGEFIPAYFQGLCLATATRDHEILGEWIGRIIEAAQSSWTYDGLKGFVIRCQNKDHHLQWARQQARWKRFLSELQSILATMERELQSPERGEG